MSISLDGAGVVLAFCVMTASVTMWAAMLTFQVRALRKSHAALREVVLQMIDVIGLRPHLTTLETRAGSRYP